MLCSKGTQLFEDEEEAFWQRRKEKKKTLWNKKEGSQSSDTGEEGSADNDAAADESAAAEKKKWKRAWTDIKREKGGEKRGHRMYQQKETPPTGDWTRARIKMMEMNEKKEETELVRKMNEKRLDKGRFAYPKLRNEWFRRANADNQIAMQHKPLWMDVLKPVA